MIMSDIWSIEPEKHRKKRYRSYKKGFTRKFKKYKEI